MKKNLKSGRVYQKTGAGILPVDIKKEKDSIKIIMTQGKIEFGKFIDGLNKEVLIKSLNLDGEDLLEGHKIQIVSTGHSKVMVGIKNEEILNGLNPKFEDLAKLSQVIGCNGYYVYSIERNGSEILVNGRMFAPAIGINEDPVTGNANGPLGAYLVHHDLIKHDGKNFRFKAKQGEAMGRTGFIDVDVEIENKEPVTVKISGNAVIAFKGQIEI